MSNNLLSQDNQMIWDNLVLEINKINEIIQSGEELKPSHIKEARAIVKKIDDHTKAFNKSVKERINTYKFMIQQKLEEIGYNKIEEYVQEQKDKNAKIRNERIVVKMDKLQSIIDDVKRNYPLLEKLSVQLDYLSFFVQLFPNVTSGDKTKEINDWSPIEFLVNALFSATSSKLELMDEKVISILPPHSSFIRKITTAFRRGDTTELKNLEVLDEYDQNIIREYKLKLLLKDEDTVIQIIEKTLALEVPNKDKIEKIREILNVYENTI